MDAIFKRAPQGHHSPEIEQKFRDILTDEKTKRKRRRGKNRSFLVKSTLQKHDDKLSIFSTDSGRADKELVSKGFQPRIIEKMNLPPINEKKPLINIITSLNGKEKKLINPDRKKHLDEQQMGITIFSDSSKRS